LGKIIIILSGTDTENIIVTIIDIQVEVSQSLMFMESPKTSNFVLSRLSVNYSKCQKVTVTQLINVMPTRCKFALSNYPIHKNSSYYNTFSH